MTFSASLLRAGPIAVALVLCAGQAEARPARCSTTDEGSYNCDFQPIGRDGSFAIAAPGKPTYTLSMTEPGVAFGSVDLGPRDVPLPGRYLRSRSEPGCWINDSTGAKLCAK